MKHHKHQTLQDAFELFIRQQNALLPDEETLSTVTLSDSFKQRMQKLLRRQKKGFFVMFGTAGRRIASIAVAVLVAATVTTVSVEALREPVFQFFAEVYEKFTQVLFVDDEPKTSTVELKKRMPTYVPAGYVVENEIETDSAVAIKYTNNKGEKLRYSQHFKKDGEVQANTENVLCTDVLIGNRQGITYKNKEINTLAFSDSQYTYTLSGNISIDELQKMAESLIFK